MTSVPLADSDLRTRGELHDDPATAADLERFATRWIELVDKHGGTHPVDSRSITAGSHIVRIVDIDDDLNHLDREELIAEARRLRAGIRAHRDSSGHDLCWHHPQLWGLLPEPIEPEVAVPPWPRFLQGCVRYRESLERELPNAPSHDREFET